MTFWIIVLRIVGVLVFLWGFLGGTTQLLSSNIPLRFDSLYRSGIPLLECVAVAVTCFGVAAGLRTLQRIDARTRKHSWLFRQVFSPESLLDTGEHRSIAPDAPAPANTARYVDDAEYARAKQPVRRIDQLYYTFRTESRKRYRGDE